MAAARTRLRALGQTEASQSPKRHGVGLGGGFEAARALGTCELGPAARPEVREHRALDDLCRATVWALDNTVAWSCHGLAFRLGMLREPIVFRPIFFCEERPLLDLLLANARLAIEGKAAERKFGAVLKLVHGIMLL